MKGKRIKGIVWFLVLIFLFGTVAGCGRKGNISEPESEVASNGSGQVAESSEEASGSASDEELLNAPNEECCRAVAYGILPAGWTEDWEQLITVKQFCQGLENIVNLHSPEAGESWKADMKEAANCDDVIYTDEAIVAVYFTACHMGIGKTTNGEWNQVAEITNGWFYRDDRILELFPWAQDPCEFHATYWISKKVMPGWSYRDSANLWIMGQRSAVSGRTIFDFEVDSDEQIQPVPLDAVEAAGALARLYESAFEPESYDGTKGEAKEIMASAEERRNSILNSKTDITKDSTYIQGQTYTGTAYYVSNDGDDNNSGTSEGEAWATIKKVNSAKLAYGDAVFFRRGDTWYGQIWGQPGVTYSAYGNGEKPVISGSNPIACKAEGWTLYETGSNGEKIWEFAEKTPDVSGIFFNDGKEWAEKIYAGWNGKNYVTYDGEAFRVEEQLSKDLTFFAEVDLSGKGAEVDTSSLERTGKLYLRCDKGNPAEVFANVNVTIDNTGISPVGNDGKGMTIDNLHFCYFASLGISTAGYQRWTGTRISNCEVSYCGGNIQQYSVVSDNGIGYPGTSGGAVHFAGKDGVAVNNYIHHCASKGFVLAIHEGNYDSTFSNLVMKGNLIENSATALHMADYVPHETGGKKNGCFENIVFEDNMVLNTGEGWMYASDLQADVYDEGYNECSIEFGGKDCLDYNNGIYITNNIFLSAKSVLINCYIPADNFPVFSGNTYAQNRNGWLALVRAIHYGTGEDAEEIMKNVLGDETGHVFVLE